MALQSALRGLMHVAGASRGRGRVRRGAVAAMSLRPRVLTTRSTEEARRRSTALLHKVFCTPVPHVLKEREVCALIEHLGGEVERPGEGHAHQLRLHLYGRHGSLALAKKSKELAGPAEVLRLRSYLSELGFAPSDVKTTAAVDPSSPPPMPWPKHPTGAVPALLVLDHAEGRVFSELDSGSAPSFSLHPYDPQGLKRHLHHKRHPAAGPWRGDTVPDDPAFFIACESALGTATDVLVVSHGKGKSCAAESFMAHCKAHRPALGARIAGIRRLNTTHMTDNELLAFAREFFITLYRTRLKKTT